MIRETGGIAASPEVALADRFVAPLRVCDPWDAGFGQLLVTRAREAGLPIVGVVDAPFVELTPETLRPVNLARILVDHRSIGVEPSDRQALIEQL